MATPGTRQNQQKSRYFHPEEAAEDDDRDETLYKAAVKALEEMATNDEP
jgi:hypothetical protein